MTLEQPEVDRAAWDLACRAAWCRNRRAPTRTGRAAQRRGTWTLSDAPISPYRRAISGKRGVVGTRAVALVALCFVSVLLLVGCDDEGGGVRGSGNVITESRDVSGFDEIVVLDYPHVSVLAGTRFETDDDPFAAWADE